MSVLFIANYAIGLLIPFFLIQNVLMGLGCVTRERDAWKKIWLDYVKEGMKGFDLSQEDALAKDQQTVRIKWATG